MQKYKNTKITKMCKMLCRKLWNKYEVELEFHFATHTQFAHKINYSTLPAHPVLQHFTTHNQVE